MAATKAATAPAPSTEEQLAAANARIAELEAGKKAPVSAPTAPEATPSGQSATLQAAIEAGQGSIVEWLQKGCPVCAAPFKTDTPVYQPTLPGLYPAVLFHYGVFHEGVIPPRAPHPDDDKALDTLVVKGIMPNGTPRWVPYRQALTEAIAEWKAGVR